MVLGPKRMSRRTNEQQGIAHERYRYQYLAATNYYHIEAMAENQVKTKMKEMQNNLAIAALSRYAAGYDQ